MSVSTDGQLCYGILFEEDFEFPWNDDRWEGDIEDWWRVGVLGYKEPFELYDEKGNQLAGTTKEQVDGYWEYRSQFDDSHDKCPVELLNVCSGDFPQYILACPDSIKVARRGYPEEVEPRDMLHTDDWFQELCGFCDKYEIDRGEEEPKWWLSSYWG